ncbi:MAG: hypothetical protein IJL26_02555 [Clostridia bacterium]|nr:hypothetical protein [Clostridia bacterium]
MKKRLLSWLIAVCVFFGGGICAFAAPADGELNLYDFRVVVAVVDCGAFPEESAMLVPRNYRYCDLFTEILPEGSSGETRTLEFIVREPVDTNAFRLLEALREDERVRSAYLFDGMLCEGVYAIGEPTTASELRGRTGMNVSYSFLAPVTDGNVRTGMLVFDGAQNGEDGTGASRKVLGLVLRGDVNCDGVISAFDARLILRAAARLFDAPGILRFAADTDGSGTVTSADARLALLRAAHIETQTKTGLDGMKEYRAASAVMRQVPLRELSLEDLYRSEQEPHLLNEYLPWPDGNIPTAVFRGRIDSALGYELEWTDENGVRFGKIPVTMLNVIPSKTYYGTLPEKETLRVLLAEPLWCEQIWHILPGEEYVFFLCMPIGEEYKAETEQYGLPADALALLSESADMICPDLSEFILPVVNEKVVISTDWFRNGGGEARTQTLDPEDLDTLKRFLYEEYLLSEDSSEDAYKRCFAMPAADFERELDGLVQSFSPEPMYLF